MTEPSRSSQVHEARHVLRDRIADAEAVEREVLDVARQFGYGESARFGIRLALQEAISNAFRHGNCNDADKTVTVDVRIDHDRVQLDVADEGCGFDPDCVPDPTADENLERPCGRGIALMRAFMTCVEFRPPGNRVHLTYNRHHGRSKPG